MKEIVKEILIKMSAFLLVFFIVILVITGIKIYQNRQEIYEKMLLSKNEDIIKLTIEILNNTSEECLIFIDDNNSLENLVISEDILQTLPKKVYKRPMFIKSTNEDIKFKIVAIKDLENNSDDIYTQDLIMKAERLSQNMVIRIVWDGNRFIE